MATKISPDLTTSAPTIKEFSFEPSARLILRFFPAAVCPNMLWRATQRFHFHNDTLKQ